MHSLPLPIWFQKIFFDIQKAFPRVWQHLICRKLYESGLKGNLPNILQDFLLNRTISVKIQDQLSLLQTIEIGVPRDKSSVSSYSYSLSMICPFKWRALLPNDYSLTTSIYPSDLLTQSEPIDYSGKLLTPSLFAPQTTHLSQNSSCHIQKA